jgi:hypothetical protein
VCVRSEKEGELRLGSMITANALNKSFGFVRKVFFPRWDRDQRWGVKRVWHLPAQGRCDRASKNILLKDQPSQEDELCYLLIHEICHAVSSPYHGRRWQDRMTKASDKASKINRRELAKMIDEEVKTQKQIPKNIDREAYDLIYDVVTASPYIKFNNLIISVAKEYGMYPREFRQRFKRCRKIFNQAKGFMKTG